MFRLLICCLFIALFSCTTPLKKRNLLVIGDSNGAGQGWVYELQKLRAGGPMVNTSLSGNTLGFTYEAGGLSTNTLENLNVYLRKGYADMGSIDEVLIALGTNDCKVEFADRHTEIATNLTEVVDRTLAFFSERGQDPPRIVLLTPPPLNDQDVVAQFQGATACVEGVAAEVRTLAASRGYCVVDLHAKPGKKVLEYSKDGIHFSREGYELIARAVVNSCY